MGFSQPGTQLVLLGTTSDALGGSAWAQVAHGHLGGRPPAVDLAAERAAASLLGTAARAGLLAAAHDISDGGLAVALTESCLAGGHGCRVSLPGDEFTFLFSESAARVVVAVMPGSEAEFASLCATHGVPATPLGTVAGASLEVAGSFAVPLDELAAAHQGVLPALFG
jgi:phosphoribosylformylglycinamidine synthase